MNTTGARRLQPTDGFPGERRGGARDQAEAWETDTAEPVPDRLPAGHVARPRLVRSIAPAGTRVTCVAAGAGFGKTVLLQEWAASEPAVAWVDAAERDGGPASFWGAVARAAGRTLGPAGTVPAELSAGARHGAAAGPGAAAALARSLDAATPAPTRLAVVIDDHQDLTGVDLQRSLASFVEHLPPSVHLVLAGRGEPALPLARWRLAGWLRELGDRDLALSADEGRALALAVAPAGGDPATVDAIVHRADGWPAALVLLAGNHPDRALADYVSQDVLEGVPAELRSFLLTTSVLRTLTPGACRAVSGRPDTGAVLHDLERRSLLTVPLGAGAFRYRRPFRAALRRQLLAEDPAAARAAHRRAAEHLVSAGDTVAAVRHWLASGEVEAAVELLARDQGRRPRTALGPWLDRVPLGMLAGDPRRTVAYATAMAGNGRVGDALGLVDRLALGPQAPAAGAPPPGQGASAPDPTVAADAGWLTAACLALLGDSASAGHALRAARRCAPGTVPRPPVAALWAEIPLGAAIVGDWDTADAQWRWGRERGLARGTPPGCRSGLQAVVDVLRGDVAAAAPALHSCLQAIDGAGHASGSAASHVLRAAAVEAAERGDLAAADALAARARRACAGFDANTTPVVAADAVAADIARRAGRPLHALQAVGAAVRRAEVTDGLSPGLRSCLAEVEVASACAAADATAAARAARHVSDPAGRAVADARVSLQRGDRRGARAALERADLGALAGRLPARALQGLVLQAAAADTRARADRALANAVDLATEHGLVGSLVADAPDVDRLLSVGGPGAPPVLAPAVDRLRRSRAHRPLEPLSTREHQVLRLLPTELSNPELAAELCVSVNTVKTHLKTIYRKLGVSGRSGAVHRARALDLLPPRPIG